VPHFKTVYKGQALNLGNGRIVSAKAGPADACTDQWICFYDCVSAGCGHWFTNSTHNYCQPLGVDRLGNSMNNRTSWIVNSGLWPYRVYDYTTCGGAEGFIGARTSGGMNPYWNDHIGSALPEPCYPIGC
jgi:hypothetical protein